MTERNLNNENDNNNNDNNNNSDDNNNYENHNRYLNSNYSIPHDNDINYKNRNDDIHNNNYNTNNIFSENDGEQNNFYDFYGNQNHGKYENNPLLDLFDSSSANNMPFTKNLDFDLEFDDDHPMYDNYTHRHGQIDTTINPFHENHMRRRVNNPIPEKSKVEEKSEKVGLGAAWVEEILLNPLSAVQVAAANINPLGLESLGLGSWLDLLNMSKAVDNYEYLTCETNPLYSLSVIQDSRALQTAIRKWYVRVNHQFYYHLFILNFQIKFIEDSFNYSFTIPLALS